MTMINASSAGPRMASVQCVSPAGPHRMAYREWGDSDNPSAVICVHGLTRTSADFDALSAELARHYRVICPDVVGRGASDWLADPMLYGIGQYASDMMALMTQLEIRQAKWVGTSMGGLIGMTLASLEESPITRMVLNDVGAELSGHALKRIAEYVGQRIRFQTREEAHTHLRKIFAGFGEHSQKEWDHLLDSLLVADQLPSAPGLSKAGAPGAAGASNAGAPLRIHYDPAIAVPFRKAYVEDLAADSMPSDLDLWPVYEKITCPTLLIRGELSDLLTAETAQKMASRGPKATLIEVPLVGHAPTLMHAHQIGWVREFLNQS